MKLYTINNLYPDQDFAFTIDAAGLGLSPISHTHAISSVDELSDHLDGKADVDHTHICVATLYNTTPSTTASMVSLTAHATGGVNDATVSISNSTITINYNSPSTGKALGLIEKNSQSTRPIIQIYGGRLESTNDEDSGFLVMEGNVNA